MKGLKKKFVAIFMVMAMTAMSAFSALAAEASVTLYGKMGDSYVASSHTSAFVGDIEDLGDGVYEVTFVKVTVYGQSGHIDNMTINGEEFKADSEGNLSVAFEYQPEDLGNITGNKISYQIVMDNGVAHPNSEGALVIE